MSRFAAQRLSGFHVVAVCGICFAGSLKTTMFKVFAYSSLAWLQESEAFWRWTFKSSVCSLCKSIGYGFMVCTEPGSNGSNSASIGRGVSSCSAKIPRATHFSVNQVHLKMVLLRQIYYDPAQLPVLEKDVEYFFNDGKVPAVEREFGIMRYFYLRNELFGENDHYSGFISWKFREKARISAHSFLDSVKSNPGYDVYILNPFPEQVLYWNTWHHAEAHHPGAIYMVNKLIKAVGLPWDILKTPNILNNASFCNFWVGNKRFWDLYMSYGLKFYDKIASDPELNDFFFRPAPGGNLKAPYFSFFFERLITEVLTHHPEIRVKGFRYSLEWLNLNFREDVAEFLFKLPQQGDLNFIDGEINGMTVADYRRRLLTEPSFFRSSQLHGKLLSFFDRHPLLRHFLSNPLTQYIKRLIIARAGNKVLDRGEIYLK